MGTMRHRSFRVGATIVIALAASLALAAPASAQDIGSTTDDDQVMLTGDLIVPADATVDTAVLFDGTATIDGTVERSVVVFNGDVVVNGTVGDDVVVFNGDVTIASGAEVGGDLVSRSTPVVEEGATVRGDQQQITGRIDLTEIGFASRFAWWVGYTASTLVLGLLLLLFAPGVDAAVTRSVRERLGASLGFGALAFIGVPIVAVLLLVTIVGIPLGVFLLLGLALIYTVAYVAGAHAIGRFVMKPPSSRYVAFLVGLAIVRALALIPVLGGLTWVVAAILGFGVLLAGRSARPTAVGTPVATPPPPPAPMPS